MRAPAKSYGGVCHSRLAKLRNGDGGQRSYISAGMASGTIRASIYLRRAKTFGPPSDHSPAPSSVRQSPSPPCTSRSHKMATVVVERYILKSAGGEAHNVNDI